MDVASDSAGLTYKRARTAAERRRIGHEASVLRRAAHPGIVQLVDTEGTDPIEALVLRTVSGGDLTALGAQPIPAIAGLGAALATTIADLHALGFSHGGIEASHVVLDEGGRPVLCSLSRSQATATSSDRRRLHDEDLRALATMLLQLLPSEGGARVARTLRGIATPTRHRPRRDAGWLARRLTSVVPDARLPIPGRPDSPASEGVGHQTRPGDSRSLRRSKPVWLGRLVGVGVGLGVLITGGAVLAGWSAATKGSHAHGPGQVAASCPATDDGCVPIEGPNGVLVERLGRYEVGRPGDVVVMGRWECESTAFPAVLRPGTGDVWTFDSWPTPTDPVVGRLVARVESAWTLRVRPGPSGCDRLEIDRRALPPVTALGTAR